MSNVDLTAQRVIAVKCAQVSNALDGNRQVRENPLRAKNTSIVDRTARTNMYAAKASLMIHNGHQHKRREVFAIHKRSRCALLLGYMDQTDVCPVHKPDGMRKHVARQAVEPISYFLLDWERLRPLQGGKQ